MEGQPRWVNPVLLHGLRYEPFGERRGLVRRQHPADHVPAEDVDDDVEVEPLTPVGASNLRDVPGPHLVGSRGDELGARVRGVAAHSTALPDRFGFAEDSVHRRY